MSLQGSLLFRYFSPLPPPFRLTAFEKGQSLSLGTKQHEAKKNFSFFRIFFRHRFLQAVSGRGGSREFSVEQGKSFQPFSRRCCFLSCIAFFTLFAYRFIDTNSHTRPDGQPGLLPIEVSSLHVSKFKSLCDHLVLQKKQDRSLIILQFSTFACFLFSQHICETLFS